LVTELFIGKPRLEGAEGDIFSSLGRFGDVEYWAQQAAALGIPVDIASSIASEQGSQMDWAILLLYRSARQPTMAEAGRALENVAAGRAFRSWPPKTHSCVHCERQLGDTRSLRGCAV
jgi:hypothetical protein